MKSNKLTLYLIPIAIALNIVASQIVFALKLPIWLDSIGVVLVAIIAGYIPALIVAFLTGLATAVTNPANIFYIGNFLLTALLAGYLARRGGYDTIIRTVGSGILNGILTGVAGSIVTIVLFGGLSSTGTGVIAGILIQMGAPTWIAAMAAGVSGDITDKIITATIAFVIILALPARTLVRFPYGEKILNGRKRVQKTADDWRNSA